MSQRFLPNIAMLRTKLKDNTVFKESIILLEIENILEKKTQLIYEKEEWVQQTGSEK